MVFNLTFYNQFLFCTTGQIKPSQFPLIRRLRAPLLSLLSLRLMDRPHVYMPYPSKTKTPSDCKICQFMAISPDISYSPLYWANDILAKLSCYFDKHMADKEIKLNKAFQWISCPPFIKLVIQGVMGELDTRFFLYESV